MSKPPPIPSSAPTAASIPPTHSGVPAVQHDAIRQASLLRDALSAKGRIGCFLGAGCPLGIYDDQGERSLNLIPDVSRLTENLKRALEDGDKTRADANKFVPCWDALVGACNDGGLDKPNVENILTELRTLTSRRGKDAVNGISKERLIALDARVCDLIVDAVGKPLPAHRGPYHRLASWVRGLEQSAPIDLFTPNYDLLIEEAFERQRIPHFDGFVGSYEPFFDIASIEQDAVPRRWARLWKLHGSINWQRRDDGAVFRVHGRAAAGKAMIYPSHLKYDESRRMPYLAMIDRLRAFFRAGGHAQGVGPPVLIVCGYSFSDDHLNEVILDGLRGNPSAQCFVLSYGDLDGSKGAVEFASHQPNMTILARDGAVVGTRGGLYGVPAAAVSDLDPWILKETSGGSGGSATTEMIRCRLGDFHFFGLFLERLYGGRIEIEHVPPHV